MVKKYIVLKVQNEIVIYTFDISHLHSDMYKSITLELVYNKLKDIHLITAGFIVKDKISFGESTTLNLKSHPDDYKLLNTRRHIVVPKHFEQIDVPLILKYENE